MARLIPPRFSSGSRRLRPSTGPRRGAVKPLGWPNTWSPQWAQPVLGTWFQLGAAGQALATVIAALVFSGLIFSGLLVFRSSDQDDLLAQGQRDLAEGRVARSVQTLRQLVRQNPHSFEGHLALGKAYLTLGDVDAAHDAFEAALRLKPTAHSDFGSGPSQASLHQDVALALAQSQLLWVEGSFEEAAHSLQSLLMAHGKQMATADRVAIQSTLTDIHQAWGESLLKLLRSHSGQGLDAPSSETDLHLKLSHLKEAILHYQQALQTVQTYAREKALKQKLLALLEQWLEGSPLGEGTNTGSSLGSSKNAGRFRSWAMQSPKEAIELLEPLVRWLPEPDLMIRLGDLYLLQVESGTIAAHSEALTTPTSPYDTAIEWYRKAYQAVPHGVGVKLAHVLTLRGKAHLKEHHEALAAADFKEADLLLGRTAGDESLATPSLLYPVTVQSLSVAHHLDRDTQTFQPSATITLTSQTHRPLTHLLVRIQMLADNKVLGEWTRIAATSKKPLEAEGLPHSKQTWSVQLKEPVPLSLLTAGGAVRVTASISYDMSEEGKKPSWELKRVQEIRIQPKKVAPLPAATTPPLPATPTTPIALPQQAGHTN